jgi:Omp85 superfamily domain
MRAAVFACLAAVLMGAAPDPDPASPDAPAEPPAAPQPSPAAPAATAAADEAKHEGRSWFALPVVFWLPETRLGFGATGGLHYDLGGAARSSSLFGAVVYTLERQGSVDVASDVQLHGGAAVTARLRATHFPDVFYGIGPDTHESARESFTRRTFDGYVVGELPALKGRLSSFRAGPRLDFRFEEIPEVEPGGALASGEVQGTSGFHGLGVGLNATYDTRDHAYWPLRGTYGQAYWTWFPARSGQPAFTHGLLEGRRFLPLGAGRVLGLAAFAEWTGGDPPFTVLPSLGSTRFLRGYRGGRFRDRLAWSGQAELRLPVIGPLSATTFAAVGDVAHSLSALQIDTIKVAGGAGLRWRLTREGANVRVDVAGGAEGVEFYLLVLEAF